MNEASKKALLELIMKNRLPEAYSMLDVFLKEDPRSEYIEWITHKSKEESMLLKKAIEFGEEYFSDMSLADFSSELTARRECKLSFQDLGINPDMSPEEINEIFDSLSDDDYEFVESNDFGQFLCLDSWRFVIIPDTNEYEGACHFYSYLIEICERNKDDDDTILHEIIHAYEHMLSMTEYREYVLLKLYKKLSKEVPELDRYISVDNHFLFQEHSILFLLKSFDLDLRMGKPLGTIYAYGRTDLFSDMLKSD